MKTLSTALFVTAITLSLNSFAQKAELCQGAYFTEAEGKAFLDSHVPLSKLAWETRANGIANRSAQACFRAYDPQQTCDGWVYGRKCGF
jgi:hypothetical protein